MRLIIIVCVVDNLPRCNNVVRFLFFFGWMQKTETLQIIRDTSITGTCLKTTTQDNSHYVARDWPLSQTTHHEFHHRLRVCR